MSEDKKMATDEQLKEIDSLVSQAGLGQNWDEFANSVDENEEFNVEI